MNQPQKTSVSLILKVANQGDFDAWQQFTAIYQPLVYRIAVAKGLQRADAEDLVQEVMTRVAKSVGRWNPNGNGTFRGWISTIARNLVIDFLRKSHRAPLSGHKTEIRHLIESAPAETEESNYFAMEYERQLFINSAAEIREHFTDQTWTAFWDTAVKNESVKGVAQKLGVNAGVVYVARSRVMARLKKQVRSIAVSEAHDV